MKPEMSFFSYIFLVEQGMRIWLCIPEKFFPLQDVSSKNKTYEAKGKPCIEFFFLKKSALYHFLSLLFSGKMGGEEE